MAKVLYKQGTKATYLGLLERLDTALYFCTDTHELYKGDDLYTDGLRAVADFSALPDFTAAADGKIYLCNDSGCGYVLNDTRDGWTQVIFGVDNETVEIGENGLIRIKAIPLSAVSGLEERLKNVETAQVGGVHYKGSVAAVDDLPSDATQGDLYEVTTDSSEWCYNGEKWFEYGRTSNLSPVATATLNPAQLAVEDGVLSVVGIESQLVDYRGKKLLDVLDEMSGALVWEDLGT